jgi:hypothetical protein
MSNSTILGNNDSLNLTVNVVAENLTATLDSNTPIWMDLLSNPIVTLLIGALLTYTLTSIRENRKEKKEISRYEYTLIADILDISERKDKAGDMLEYYNKEKRNPYFVKLENHKVILQFMREVMDDKKPTNDTLKYIKRELKKKI